jgi:hypothetical protein
MDMDLKFMFVEELDNIYKTNLIYRTIVVCNDDDVLEYKNILETKDFSVYLVDTPSNNHINYDDLDSRIILINSNKLEEFLNNIISNKTYSFYTHIIFTPDTENMKDLVCKKYYNYSEIFNNII